MYQGNATENFGEILSKTHECLSDKKLQGDWEYGGFSLYHQNSKNHKTSQNSLSVH